MIYNHSLVVSLFLLGCYAVLLTVLLILLLCWRRHSKWIRLLSDSSQIANYNSFFAKSDLIMRLWKVRNVEYVNAVKMTAIVLLTFAIVASVGIYGT